MADRASASIQIGGDLPIALVAALVDAAKTDAASPDWDENSVEIADVKPGETFTACAHQLANGEFEALEAFCIEHGLPFVRESDGCLGAYGPERVVFTGSGRPRSYASLEQEPVITLEQLRALGSMGAVEAWFAEANMTVPQLVLVDTAALPDTNHAGA